MKKRLKKILINPALITCVVAIVLGAIFGPVLALRAANMAQHASAAARMASYSITGMTQNKSLVPLGGASTAPTMWQRPSEKGTAESTVNVYTGDRKQIFLLEGTDILVTEDGFVTINDSSSRTVDGSVVVRQCEEFDEIVDGANRKLRILLNSFLDINQLVLDGRYTREIKLDVELYMVSYEISPDNFQFIYVSVEYYETGWWIFKTPHLRFLDMNRRVLNNDLIGFPDTPNLWGWGNITINPFKWVGTVNEVINFINELEKWSATRLHESTTLRALLHEVSFATDHPWPRLYCPETGDWVKAEDGRDIRVSPRRGQLTDNNGFALFSLENGLPIIFLGGQIVTTNLKPQVIENGVLLDSMTVWEMLQSGLGFHMHIIPTPFGPFDVPVFNKGTEAEPDWRLMNGDSTAGITMHHEDASVLDTYRGFWSGIEFIFGNTSNGLSFMQIIGIAVAILLIIMLAPIVFKVVIVTWKLCFMRR
jgi:hypothetical protein